MKKQVSHGIYLQGAYTWSRSLTTVYGGDGTNGVFAGGSGNSNDPDNRYARYGLAGFDRTNRFVVAYTYQFPGIRNGSTFARMATNGWKLNGTSTFQSGKPLTFTDSGNGTGYGTTASRAQFAAGMGNSNIVNHGNGTLLNRIKTVTYLNSKTSVFTPAPPVPYAALNGNVNALDFGNSSIGAARGPGNDNSDMAIVKSTRVGGIRETASLDFRTEFFNVFNHPEYGNPATAVNAGSYGQITASASSPRLIQFALKYTF